METKRNLKYYIAPPISIPTIVNGEGVKGTLLPELTPDEVEKLRHSAEVLKGVIAQVDFTQS
jgi:L-lactate dehydrogenase